MTDTPFGDWSGPRGTGANQPRPMNAPPARELSIGVQPGTSNIVRARFVIIFGPNGGLFVYNGTPGIGNPPVAWISTGPTDPFGNVLPAAGASGLNGLPFLSYAQLSTGGFTTQFLTGAGNFTAPAGVTSIKAECWGPGGNGGTVGGQGGGGGEYAAEPALAVTPGNLYAFSVGAAGSGSSTTFAGDSVTVTAHAGTGGVPTGAGGTGSTNTTHHNGGNGGSLASPGTGSGGGGSSAGTFTAGNPGANGSGATGGAGGSAPTGGGAGGKGANGGGSGAAGSAPGGGGGGSNGIAGGAGAAGQIKLTYSATTTTESVLASLTSAAFTDQLGNYISPGWTVDTQLWLIPSGDTSGATDTANVAAAYAAGIKSVYCVPGNFWGTPVVPDSCELTGAGMSTVWNLPANSATLANMITNGTNAQYCRISDMTLDGNNANQGAGAWQAGIVLNNPPADGRHIVSRVRIQNFTGDGLVQLNRGSSQFSDIQIFGCNGFGVNAHEDCYYTNIDVGASGLDGFLIQGGSNRFASCKSFFSGAALVSGRGAGATLLTVTPPAQAFDGGSLTGGFTFSLASGFGSGFHYANIGGTSVVINASAGEIAACCAQDNARNGFLLNSRRMVLTAIDADSNNNNGTTGGAPNASYAGVEITGNRNNVQGVSWNRAANVNAQAGALEIIAGVGQATLNRVDLGFDGSLNDGSNMPPMTALSTFYDNGLTFRTMGGRGFEPHAFAASFTPDPFAAETFEITLTANITVNAPALAGTNTAGIFLIPGMLMRIVLIEDGVGAHTVTFNAIFAGATAANTAANRTNVWTFVFDGTNWLECSFQNF